MNVKKKLALLAVFFSCLISPVYADDYPQDQFRGELYNGEGRRWGSWGDLVASITLTEPSTAQSYTGNGALKVVYDGSDDGRDFYLGWGQAGVDSTGTDVTGYNKLVFWIKTTNVNLINTMKVTFQGKYDGNHWDYSSTKDDVVVLDGGLLAPPIADEVAELGEWQKVEVNLSAFDSTVGGGCDFTNLKAIVFAFTGNAAVTCYIDNVYLYNTSHTIPVISKAEKISVDSSQIVYAQQYSGALQYEFFTDTNSSFSHAEAKDDSVGPWVSDGAGGYKQDWERDGILWGDGWADAPGLDAMFINRSDTAWYKMRVKLGSGLWTRWSNPVQVSLDTKITLTGNTLNSGLENWAPVSDVWVMVYDEQGNFIREDVTHSPFSLGELELGKWYYIRAEAEGYTFPSAASESWDFDGSETAKGLLFQANSTLSFMTLRDIPLDPGYPIELEKKVSKNSVVVGDIITTTVKVSNVSKYALDNILLKEAVPKGFKIVENSFYLDGVAITPTDITDSVYTFEVSPVPGFGYVTLRYQMVVSTGVPVGRSYDITSYAWHKRRNWRMAEDIITKFVVGEETLFTRGLLIGKVFADNNENALCDAGEKGIAGVKLVTEQGVVVFTDQDGKYHIPDLTVGRHVIKIDKASLPKDAKVVSEETYLFNTTEGLLSKVNFAIKSDSLAIQQNGNGVDVLIRESLESGKSRLGISTFKRTYKLNKDDSLVEDIEFLIDTNFGQVIKTWELTVLDKENETVAMIFGEYPLPSTIVWNGKEADEMALEKNAAYYYRLKVWDKDDHLNSTPYNSFNILSIDNQQEAMQFSDFNTFKEKLEEADRKVQDTIPLGNMSTIVIEGNSDRSEQIFINDREVIVDQDGRFKVDLIVPSGENYVTVTKKDKDGHAVSYLKEIVMQDNYFFFVGLAEKEYTKMNSSGNLELVGEDNYKFKDGIYSEGKMAYYLKAKVKGKYIITSSLDTTRERKEIFTNLDPEKYYPVYGDASSINYDANDTQGVFYLLIEKDDSYFKWGNYNTEIEDTIYGQYRRSLFGGKIYYESVAKTINGEPNTTLVVFDASIHQLASHDELLGTGGTLYYLKNRNVIEGSEKVKIEVRDKNSNLPLSSYVLKRGLDYTITYDQARIQLKRPLSLMTDSNSIISNSIVSGHRRLIVVDYEYASDNIFSNKSVRGIRATKHFTDSVKGGGTYITEDRDVAAYRLEGTDWQVKLGNLARVEAEFNSSFLEQTGSYVSSDGGLTYDMITSNASSERRDAKAVKIFSTPLKKLTTSAYYSDVDSGFSSSNSIMEQGIEKFGLEFIYDLFTNHSIRLKHDNSRFKDGNPYSDLLSSVFKTAFLGPMGAIDAILKTEISTLQTISNIGKWTFVQEYQYKKDILINGRPTETLGALKAAYAFNDILSAYVGQQFTITHDSSLERNDQSLVGINTKLGKLSLDVAERIGSKGDSTILGAGYEFSEQTNLYSNISKNNEKGYGSRYDTTFGSVTSVTDKYRVYTEEKYSTYDKGNAYGSLVGMEKDINDFLSLDVNFERYDVKEAAEYERNAGSFGVNYYKKDFLRASHRFDLRVDNNVEQTKQFATFNKVHWSLTDSVELLSLLNYSRTKDETNELIKARFVKASIGLSYRPVDFDALNFIVKCVYLNDLYPEVQRGDIEYDKEESKIYSAEVVYDFWKYFQVVEKFSTKQGTVKYLDLFTRVETYLWINRLNYHLLKEWDVGVEYRILAQKYYDNQKAGFLVEVNRKFGKYLNLGVGYNCTEFDDDLASSNDYDAKGWFVRMSAQY